MKEKIFPSWVDLLLILGVFGGVNLAVGQVVAALTGGKMTGLATFFIYTATFAATITFALWLARRRAEEPVIRLTFRGIHPPLVLWGLVLMAAGQVVIEPLISLFPREWYELVSRQITNGGWAMLTAIVAAPICEEILFRGILQKGLVRKWGPVGGIFFASAVFGLIHGIPQQIVAGFFMGLILGWIYWRTGSLVAAMILHAINNALGVFMTLFESERSAEESLRQSLDNDPLYTALYIGSALLIVGSLLIAIFVRNRKAVEQSE